MPKHQLKIRAKSTLKWLNLSQCIREDKRIRWECSVRGKNKYVLTLTIKNPSLADGGMYRCNAFNPFGDSNANIDLNFESKMDEPILTSLG